MMRKNGMRLDSALDCILRSGIEHLMESQPAVGADQKLKGVHQYRVALRRLRAVLELMRAVVPSSKLERFGKDARWLMSCLSEVRDWDVFTTQTLPAIAKACPSIEGFDALRRVADRRWRRAHGKARAAIVNPRAKRFLIALNQWVEQKEWSEEVSAKKLKTLSGSVDDFAVRILDDLHREVLRRGRSFRTLSPEERHRLRIALKRLRIAANVFLPLITKMRIRGRYLKALSGLQEQLGRHNDLVVMEQLVRQFKAKEMSAASHRASGALLGWRVAHSERDDADLIAAWKKFTSRSVGRY